MTRYRWWIGSLLLGSTIINYIDRQTLSVLAPFLEQEQHWTHRDFAWIVIAFRVAYATMPIVAGRIIDRLGTRQGMTLGVANRIIAMRKLIAQRRYNQLLVKTR